MSFRVVGCQLTRIPSQFGSLSQVGCADTTRWRHGYAPERNECKPDKRPVTPTVQVPAQTSPFRSSRSISAASLHQPDQDRPPTAARHSEFLSLIAAVPPELPPACPAPVHLQIVRAPTCSR